MGPGAYVSFSGLPSGTYYVLAWSSEGHIAELYDGIECPGGTCGVTTGTPVQVEKGKTTLGIDFELDHGGRIAGRLLDASTQQPFYGCVNFYDADAAPVTYGCADPETGEYLTYAGLPEGEYYGVSDNGAGYIDELWQGVQCAGGVCDPLAGDPIPVWDQQTTPGVDFDLEAGGRIAGTVTTPNVGQLSHPFVRVFDPTGNYIDSSSACCNPPGAYETNTGLPTGTYYVTTNTLGWFLDELYKDLPCIDGDCVPATGTPVQFVAPQTTTGIDFELAPDRRIFGDGFESGDTAAWDQTVD